MKGRVLELRGDRVLIQILPEAGNRAAPAACRGCADAAGRGAPCAAAESCPPAEVPGGPVLVARPPGPAPRPGQTVELRRRGLVSQAAAALLPPGAGFAAGYTLAARLLPPGGPELIVGLPAGEGARAAAGLCGMLLAALAFYGFRCRRPAGPGLTIGPWSGDLPQG
jgi:hypothetical protein